MAEMCCEHGCQQCFHLRMGVCCICYENPFGYVDADGQKWDICWACAAMENMAAQTWPG